MAKKLLIDGAQLARLMRLCRALCGNSGVPFALLQKKLRRSRRSLFRDLRQLGTAGIRVGRGPTGYRILDRVPICQKALANAVVAAVQALIDAHLI